MLDWADREGHHDASYDSLRAELRDKGGKMPLAAEGPEADANDKRKNEAWEGSPRRHLPATPPAVGPARPSMCEQWQNTPPAADPAPCMNPLCAHNQPQPAADPAGGDAAVELKIAKAEGMVSALCQPKGTVGKREWIMSIPARPDHDPDLVIADALHSAGRQIAALRRERDEWRRRLHEFWDKDDKASADRLAVVMERDQLKARVAELDRYRRSSDKELADARAAAATWQAERDKLAAELADTKRRLDGSREEFKCVADQLSDMKAELAAMKARKVKLPKIDQSMTDYSIGFRDCLVHCKNAVRAAGVELADE